ncbi:T9SS type A sorting domain-containing protein [Hymenobacter lutimineralis]|uniref:T9SS type A sorting domain-containing protein n=1 Tax=Hymenobacter lutimineralis TaxID=2606448 RepID=A0A5D6VBI8_9BACT|nr:T9SS type A sorting domain-containing protein [Hymenobacter lutimineralis]TYZ13341.1 T9SS type A sorting domain-containing protein [Hymenobacter lutimineralis]
MRVLLLLPLAAVLTGCEEPVAVFEAFELPRPVNMARVLGPAPLLLGQDTLALRLRYAPATGVTTFWVQTDSSDQSWFAARAFRYRGLYYLVENQPEDGYRIHAVRIGRGQVQGLGTGYRQMRALSEAVWQGRFPQLLSPAGDSMRLRYDRQRLRAFYTAQVEGFAPYAVVDESTASLRSDLIEAQAAAPSLYPNPASTTATLTLAESGAREVSLYTKQGQLLRSYLVSTASLALPVDDLPNGLYLVRVKQAGKASATLRLQVSH